MSTSSNIRSETKEDIMSLWAVEVEKMSLSARQSANFGPYMVSPWGSLCLPIEMMRVSGPGRWPTGPAPGWTPLLLRDGTEHRQWLPLGSEFFFRGDQPIAAHAPSSHPLAGKLTGEIDALSLVLRGEAFPFDNRFFVLPPEKEFIMNSFQYEVADMERLGVFTGYRGHTKRFTEVITPGIHRRHNHPSKEKHETWVKRSRVASNILKQRFLERENKPLTHMEAIGILQHYYIIGATDLLDLTFDLDVAKWFSLNEYVDSKNDKKKYSVAVRLIGEIELDGETADAFTRGITLRYWDGLSGVARGAPKVSVPPFNLAPLWSEYPKQQRGFGVRGIYRDDEDTLGSILKITEHLFHPVFFKDGWDQIGGPQFRIDGKRYTHDSDSSAAADYLLPEPAPWFKDIVDEVQRVVEKLA